MAARDDVADRARGDVERAAGERVLQPMIERLEETAEDDEAYREAETDALAAVRHCAAALSTRERALLDELRDWARGAQDRPDAKLNAPREGLDPIVAQDQRVIIFTEYRDTQRWLHERLLTAGVPG